MFASFIALHFHSCDSDPSMQQMKINTPKKLEIKSVQRKEKRNLDSSWKNPNLGGGELLC